MSGGQPLSRLDALRFARRVVEQQAARQPAVIDGRIADEERPSSRPGRAAAGRTPTASAIQAG
ncbi:hypothetical protein [Streptomyces sp. NPDC054794]